MELDSPQLYYCLLPFTTISIVLYTQVLIELFRKRGLEAYDGFFYRMICSQSIYDISYVIMYFVIEIPKDWPTLLPGMNGTILHQVLYTHAHLCHFGQMLGVTMMAVTRMLHVCHPSHDFTSALQNLGVWKVALFHSILPVIYGIYMLVGQDWVTQYFVKHAARVTRGAAAESIVTNSNILCVCAVSCALVSASCYIYVFLTLRERPDRSSRDETTIQVTSLVLFFALCTLAAYFVCNLLSFGTDINSYILCASSFSGAVASAFCYIRVFLALRKRPLRSYRSELSILATSFALFCALCATAGYFVCNMLFVGANWTAFYTFRKHFYAFSFFLSLANPWCLMFTSESMRSSVICHCLPSCLTRLPLCARCFPHSTPHGTGEASTPAANKIAPEPKSIFIPSI